MKTLSLETRRIEAIRAQITHTEQRMKRTKSPVARERLAKIKGQFTFLLVQANSTY